MQPSPCGADFCECAMERKLLEGASTAFPRLMGTDGGSPIASR